MIKVYNGKLHIDAYRGELFPISYTYINNMYTYTYIYIYIHTYITYIYICILPEAIVMVPVFVLGYAILWKMLCKVVFCQ